MHIYPEKTDREHAPGSQDRREIPHAVNRGKPTSTSVPVARVALISCRTASGGPPVAGEKLSITCNMCMSGHGEKRIAYSDAESSA